MSIETSTDPEANPRAAIAAAFLQTPMSLNIMETLAEWAGFEDGDTAGIQSIFKGGGVEFTVAGPLGNITLLLAPK